MEDNQRKTLLGIIVNLGVRRGCEDEVNCANPGEENRSVRQRKCFPSLMGAHQQKGKQIALAYGANITSVKILMNNKQL